MANNLIVCGGTFDHFHKGHESFLKLAFPLGSKVIVGITSDQYAGNSKLEARSLIGIETFEKRKGAVSEFIKREKVLDKTEIIKIEDLFGPTLAKDLLIDAIVVSEDTKKAAEIINQKRKELGLVPLEIIIAPVVHAEDGKPISSARIRNGEINRDGKLFVNPIWLKTDLVLPENLREEFHKPFGELGDVKDLNIPNDSLIITVGDETSKKFNESSIKQNISVIDFKIARKEAFSSFADLGFKGTEKVIIAENPAGHITHELFSKVFDIFKSGLDKRIILKITGEDDLAVLPLILAAPLGTAIYYGQPNEGLVGVLVSEELKEKVYKLASKFKPI